jgi:chromosome segregation ATPase
MPDILSGVGRMLSREKVANAATELAEHLKIIENIRSLQTAQKEVSDELRSISQRIFELQVELRALKAEVKFESLKEAQMTVNAVQGGLNQRLETLSNKMAVIEATLLPGSFGIDQRSRSPESTRRIKSSETVQDS